jgi:acetyl esterase
MPLHPALQEIVDITADAKNPPVSKMSLHELRKGPEQLMLLGGEPELVARTINHIVDTPNGKVIVRLYYPHEKAPLPAFVFFHPGGFVKGDVNYYDPVCLSLANASECLVISVNYSLAPESRFPAALEDAFAVLCWVSRSSKEIRTDGRIAVGGENAGGNLAAICTHRARDRGDPKIDAQVLIYPEVDFTFSQPSHEKFKSGYLLEENSLKWYASQYLPEGADPKDPEISPLFAPRWDGLPPGLIITAEYDPLRDEGEAYANKLRQAGGIAILHRYTGMLHGFFQMGGVVEEGRKAIEEVGGFIKTIFGIGS